MDTDKQRGRLLVAVEASFLLTPLRSPTACVVLSPRISHPWFIASLTLLSYECSKCLKFEHGFTEIELLLGKDRHLHKSRNISSLE